jgi:hypothetical protein
VKVAGIVQIGAIARDGVMSSGLRSAQTPSHSLLHNLPYNLPPPLPTTTCLTTCLESNLPSPSHPAWKSKPRCFSNDSNDSAMQLVAQKD